MTKREKRPARPVHSNVQLKTPELKEEAVKPVLFIHIPKTAGTSLRIEAARLFGRDRVALDYGPKSSETSADVMQLGIKCNDPWALHDCLQSKDVRALCGHFQAARYISAF